MTLCGGEGGHVRMAIMSKGAVKGDCARSAISDTPISRRCPIVSPIIV